MKRTLYIAPNNELQLSIATSMENRTWYFVHWNKEEVDGDGNYIIYTYQSTFGNRNPVFKCKDWSTVCKMGNMINGLFHEYFQISKSYPLDSPLILNYEQNAVPAEPTFWSKLKSFFLSVCSTSSSK